MFSCDIARPVSRAQRRFLYIASGSAVEDIRALLVERALR